MFGHWAMRVLVLALVEISQENSISSEICNFMKSQIPIKINVVKCLSNGQAISFTKSLITNYHVSIISKVVIPPGPSEHHLYLLDLTCPQSRNILQQADELKLLSNPYKWLLIGTAESISDLYFAIDSQIFILNSTDVTTIHKLEATETNFRHISPAAKRTNLMGTTIKSSIVITNNDSLKHLWDYRNKHIDSISKYNYLLMHHMLDFLNASKEIKIRNTWGYKNETTGLYSGMVGDLQTGLAELGGTPLFFTIDRIDIVDYIIATTPTYMKFIFRAPPLSYVTNIFTLPFATSVWHYSFAMVGIVVASIYLIVWWEWKSPQFRNHILDKHPTTLQPKIFDVIMMEVGAITQQGSDVEPKSNSGRIITFFTFATLMFLYTSYAANVVALLQSTTNSIRTLDDLLNFRIKLGVEDIVYAHHYFKVGIGIYEKWSSMTSSLQSADEPVRKAIYEQKVAPKNQKANFMDAQEGIRLVRDEFFAFHVELSTGYKIIGDLFREHEKCGLKEIAYVSLLEPWIAVRKNSMYKEVIKIGMRKLHEHGIQNREIRRIYTRKPQCHSGGSNFAGVGLIDCYAAFLIFAIGIAICGLLFVLELITQKCLITTT